MGWNQNVNQSLSMLVWLLTSLASSCLLCDRSLSNIQNIFMETFLILNYLEYFLFPPGHYFAYFLAKTTSQLFTYRYLGNNLDHIPKIFSLCSFHYFKVILTYLLALCIWVSLYESFLIQVCQIYQKKNFRLTIIISC